MTRRLIAARIITLNEAIDLLAHQAARDGYGPYGCVRPMEVHMRYLECELRRMDSLSAHSIMGGTQ